ncbi:MAG: ABC transporter permease [Candidatus Solibacter sp.]
MPDFQRLVREHLPALHMRPERESEIVAELALQLEQAYAEAILGGAKESDALRKALAQMGDWNKLGRSIDVVEPRPSLTTGWQHDLRFALRFFARNPAFSAIATLTLAFGIGGNTAIFTMVDALVLRGLPYPAPERLVAIETRKAQQPEIDPWTSAPDFFDMRAQAKSFSAMAALSPVWNVVLTGRGRAEQLDALYVSAEFFPMLGVNAALGRVFAPAEDQGTKPSPVVLLSHEFWQRRFAGNRDVIGQSLNLDGGTFTVIGVLPADFRYGGEPLAGSATQIAVWFPMSANQLVGSVRSVRYLKVVARLRDGVSVSRGREEARGLAAGLAAQHPEFDRGFEWDVRPLSDQVTGKLRMSMLLLLGTVGFVLLMACANVANLQLARAVARQREIAVRMALGAGVYRLLRQLLTEGLVLAAMGGLVGLPLAWAGLRFLIAVGPPALVQTQAIRLDGRALLFTSATVLLCTLVAGLPLAWRTVRTELGVAMRQSGRGLAGGHHRVRAALVSTQVAVALVLLVGAGLLVRSFITLLDVNPGFDAQNVITISTQLPASARTPAIRAGLYRTIYERLRAIPGVVEVGAVSRLPMTGKNLGSLAFIEGKSTPGQPGFDVEYRVATPTYFATMGIPLRAGRYFDNHDDANPAAVVLVNQSMAHKYWPGESAVGKRIKLSSTPERAPWITVVGVVGDVRHFAMDIEPRAEVYRPYAVNPLGAPILAVRVSGDAASMKSGLSAAVRAIDAEIPTYNEFVMRELVERSTTQRRFVMLLLAGFAVAALLLAGVGIYGTVSQAVAQRTQEIGVRMALGAPPGAVLRLVFGEGVRMMGAGLVFGGVAATGLAWLMRGMLFAIGPMDPAAFLVAVAILAVFALAACYVPARRATRVDPTVALRQE